MMSSHTMCTQSRCCQPASRSAWKNGTVLFTRSTERYTYNPTLPIVMWSLHLVFVFLQLRKSISTPPFPSKRIRCSQPKVLEQRRAGLERYLQTVFKIEGGYKQVMEFLGLEYQPRYDFCPYFRNLNIYIGTNILTVIDYFTFYFLAIKLMSSISDRCFI